MGHWGKDVEVMLSTGLSPHSSVRCPDLSIHHHIIINTSFLLTRHGIAIQIGSDDFLQLVVRGRLLKPQAQVVLQVLVELVTWKQQTDRNSSSKQTTVSKNLVVYFPFSCCHFTKSKVMKGSDISTVEIYKSQSC